MDTPTSEPAAAPPPDEQPDGRPDARPDALRDLLQEDGPRRSTLTRAGLLVAAGVLFVLGVIFWLIPVVTGLPFYVLALVMAGMASRRIARLVNRCERRLPHRCRTWLRPSRDKGVAGGADGAVEDAPDASVGARGERIARPDR